MNKTVINAVIPETILPSIAASGVGCETEIIDLFDALGGKALNMT